MQKKPAIIISVTLIVLVGLLLVFKHRNSQSTSTTSNTSNLNQVASLNQIPVTERPFATLTPDTSGHNLFFHFDNLKTKTTVDYEIVYTAGDKEEGAFGHLDLIQETLPVTKKILLGSKSAGGSITYHEGVTGGYLTLAYDDIKLKEDFNFLHFDSQNEDGYSSVDARFTAYFKPNQLPKNAVILIMKSFGLPAELPTGKIVAGPYYVGTAKDVIPDKVEIRMPDGADWTFLEYKDNQWLEIKKNNTFYNNGLLTFHPTSNLFVVVE